MIALPLEILFKQRSNSNKSCLRTVRSTIVYACHRKKTLLVLNNNVRIEDKKMYATNFYQIVPVKKSLKLVKILVRVREPAWMVFFHHPEQVYEVSLAYYEQLWRYRLCSQNFNQIV